MKKLLYIILLAIFATIVTSCDTMGEKDNKPLSFPTLKYCNPEMLNSDKSFICIQRQEGADLIETNIKFDTSGVSKKNNAELRVTLPGFQSVKFHHQTLESVIEYEKSIK